MSIMIEQTSMKDDEQPLPDSHQELIKMFKGHEEYITSIATFPDGRKIATGSYDKTIRIWRLEEGTDIMKWVVKKHVGALVILKNGKHVVSAEGEDPEDDYDKKVYWQLWVRHAETGSVVAGPLPGHTNLVITLDISPNGEILASGSFDRTVILWDTTTWHRQGDPLSCGAYVMDVRFSPSGQLGIGTSKDIQIWDVDRRERLAHVNGHADFNDAWNGSLTWTRDGAHLLSAGNDKDPVIRSWETSTWKQDGNPWTVHDEDEPIYHITLNTAGTLLASASGDCTVCLWQLPTGTEVARFKHSHGVFRVAFSLDGRSIFSGGEDKKISQWDIPEEVLTAAHSDALTGQLTNKAGLSRGKKRNRKGFLDSEIPGQRRNKPVNYQRMDRPRAQAVHFALPRGDAERSLSSRLHGVTSFFNRIQLSSNKGKQKEYQPKRNAPQVINVPLGQATYGDAVGVDDGTRPCVVFFCLSWFQKAEKKPNPPPPVYDVDLMNDEREENILDIPIPTTCQREEIELTSLTGQSQLEAGPSRLAVTE